MIDTVFPEELTNFKEIIAAAETEDEIGTVLRLHLVIEEFLKFYLSRKRIGEIATYTNEPKYFAGKLYLSVAFGLPIPIARVAHQINKIRNNLAHKREGLTINPVDIKELARRVNLLSEIDSSFTPVENQSAELPVKYPGEKIAFGSGGVRTDFLIAVMAYYGFMIRWVVGTELK